MDPPLTELAVKHGTDKHREGKVSITRQGTTMEVGGHLYAPHYDFHFGPFRHRGINVLEIGVGGFEDPKAGGESLRMWKEYFPKAQIVSLDYYDKTALQEDRIRIYRGSQDDPALLKRMHDECGGFDIIVDDGSHRCDHVIASFKILFPLLRSGGIYAVEDLETSYWKVTGGSSNDMNATTSSMGFFKSLLDGLNHKEFEIPGYQPTYFDKHIVSMTFYHNLVIIYKGDNDEESNVMVDNQMPEALAALYPKFDWLNTT
ncbi:uncharacterized protein N0V96_002189 [Colletotrichum fioriniae]|uniref:uncharacterized protein n=1 Tax=Colletotrichum fioriniae TaxID=710243 RepID=UPI00230017BB|nr:uncharacterized protein COL516b_000692 [Colletotrichum fioriniae]KAJ0313749.1 hypothetical protein COL516b_000692 [Colletotrichum fioriniae]KAJ3947950.1 hypothetical protein N0V96_002189 [Colletotrichum fioriniae]